MGPIPPFFASRAGELRIGGYDVSALVRAAGATPLFVYDMSIVRARLEGLRRALPAEIGLSYAMKANPFGPLVKAMAPLVEGMDVASRAELTQAVGAGARAISLAGPGKRDEDLAAAIAAGATINLESEAELHRALAAGCRLGRRPQLAVRINPDFGLRGAGLLMGGGARPFGVDVDLVPQLVRDILASSADWAGFHLFAGSQSLDTRALIAMHKAAFGLCDRLAREVGAEPRQITLGSGFGVPYAAGDFEIDIKAIGRALAEALAARSAHLASSQIILELGRYLVAEAGVYLTRILDRKNSHGQVFLVVDGGMHHQLAAAGLLGAVVRRNYPIAIATRFGLPVQEAASIVGCLCTPLDRLADQVAVPRAEPGDLVALFLAGAYGATASPAAFLGHGPAHELLVDGAGQDHGLLRLVGRS